MIKLRALLVVRRIVSWQILCMDKCLLPNIEALYINSPVPPCDCRRKCTATTPLLVYVSFAQNHAHFCVRVFLQKYTQEGACSMHICKFYLLLDFSP